MTSIWVIAVWAGALVASWLGTGWARRYALRRNMIDRPGERSSHREDTPRGGGIAIVAVFAAGVVALRQAGVVDDRLLLALLPGGLALGLVGWLDDHGGLSVRLRLLVHFLAAGWLLYVCGAPEAIAFGPLVWHWGWAGHLVLFLGIVWFVNSYNFMDGIDGIAGGTAVTTSLGGTFLFILSGRMDLAALSGLLAASSLGFLPWNWPRPRALVFMGDVSSGFLGYAFAAFWLLDAKSEASGLWLWPLLLGVFMVDATCTRLVLLLRERDFFRPHNTHAYQCLANRMAWGHLRVTACVLAINVLWLWPWAYAAWHFERWTGPLAVVALLPLGAAWLWVRRRCIQ